MGAVRAPSATSARGGAFRAFRSRDFTFMWAGSLLSITSFFMLIMARSWLVLEMTNSAFMLTAVAGVSQVPSLFFSVFGGVLADRVNRKIILLATEGANLLVLVVLAALVATDTVQVWHLFALGLVNGTAFALAMPARAAIVPNLVPREDIANGVALSSTMFSGAQLIGPAVAGVVMDRLGMTVAFVLPALALIPTMVLFSLVRLRRDGMPHHQATGSVVANIREGLVYIRTHEVILGLMVISLVGIIFGMPYQNLIPVFARDILHSGQIGLGLLSAAGGLGAIAGSFAVAARNSPGQLRSFLIMGVLGVGALIIVFAFSPLFWLSMGVALLLGFLFQVFMIGNFALLQTLVPDHLRGRVISVRMVVFGLSPLGILMAGAVAESLGTPIATALTGALCLVGGVLTLARFPSLRRGSRPATEPVPAEPKQASARS